MRLFALAALLLPTLAHGAEVGDTVFAATDTPSLRFPDAEDAGPTLAKDSELVVLVVEAERLRVMAVSDTSFGWIPTEAVTTERPPVDLEAMIQQLNLEGMGGPMGGGMGGLMPATGGN